MARQRASQARDAFARVGTAPVTSTFADDDASVMASENESLSDVQKESKKASVTDVQKESRKASVADVSRAGRKAGKSARRPGRPRGPERTALTVRILTATNDRLTTAVDLTGDSPQYIVDAALAAYLDALGV